MKVKGKMLAANKVSINGYTYSEECIKKLGEEMAARSTPMYAYDKFNHGQLSALQGQVTSVDVSTPGEISIEVDVISEKLREFLRAGGSLYTTSCVHADLDSSSPKTVHSADFICAALTDNHALGLPPVEIVQGDKCVGCGCTSCHCMYPAPEM